MKKELELYELILLFKFTSMDKIENQLATYRKFLIERGSQVMLKNHGKISLAYNIKGFDTAVYVQIVYLGNGELTKQLGVELQRDELTKKNDEICNDFDEHSASVKNSF